MNTSIHTAPDSPGACWQLQVHAVLQFTLARCAVSQVQTVKSDEVFLMTGPASSIFSMAHSYKGPWLFGLKWRRVALVLIVSFHCVRLFMTLWTVAHKAPLSMVIPRQEYWSVLLFPSPGDLLDPGIEPASPALKADSLLSEPPEEPQYL